MVTIQTKPDSEYPYYVKCLQNTDEATSKDQTHWERIRERRIGKI